MIASLCFTHTHTLDHTQEHTETAECFQSFGTKAPSENLGVFHSLLYAFRIF